MAGIHHKIRPVVDTVIPMRTFETQGEGKDAGTAHGNSERRGSGLPGDEASLTDFLNAKRGR